MAQNTQTPPTSFGVIYPEGDVVTVIDDGVQAARAVEALRRTGIAGKDIVLLSGPEAAAAVQSAQAHVGFFKYLFEETFMDELTLQGDYLDQAQQGRSILRVRAYNLAHARQIRGHLAPYHAHSVMYYGHATVTDLTDDTTADPLSGMA